METILSLRRKFFKDKVIKEKLTKAVYEKDIEKIKRNLKILECMEPKKVVKFLEEILKDLIDVNEQHKAQLGMLDTLNKSIEILRNDCKDKIDKIKELERKYKSMLHIFSTKKDKIRKNDEIIDILKQALFMFRKCKNTYPKVLPKLFKYINDRKVKKIEKIIDVIKEHNKKDISYIEEQINNSYTMSSLKEEIKHLKLKKESKKSTERLKLDLKVLRTVRKITSLQKQEVKKSIELNMQYKRII